MIRAGGQRVLEQGGRRLVFVRAWREQSFQHSEQHIARAEATSELAGLAEALNIIQE